MGLSISAQEWSGGVGLGYVLFDRTEFFKITS